MGNAHPVTRIVNRRTKRAEFVDRKENQKRSDDPCDRQFHERLQEDIVEEEIQRTRRFNMRDGLIYRSDDLSVTVIEYWEIIGTVQGDNCKGANITRHVERNGHLKEAMTTGEGLKLSKWVHSMHSVGTFKLKWDRKLKWPGLIYSIIADHAHAKNQNTLTSKLQTSHFLLYPK